MERKITKNEMILGRYLPFFKPSEKKITLLKAPTGSGKTTLVANLVQQDLEESKRVVAVTPFVSLTNNYAKVLGISSYQADIDLQNDSVAVCLPSLWKVAGKAVESLYVSEIDRIIADCYSNIRKPSENKVVFDTLVYFIKTTIQNGGKVFLDSATVTDEVLFFLNEIVGMPFDYIFTENMNDVSLHILTKKDEFKFATHRSLAEGYRMAVGFSSDKSMKSFALKVTKEVPNAKVLAINSAWLRDNEEQAASFMANPNAYIIKNGITHFLYTSAVGTGISIDVENYFQMVFVEANRAIMDVTNVVQMASRVRNPIQKDVLVYVYGSFKHKETNVKNLAKADVISFGTVKNVVRNAGSITFIYENFWQLYLKTIANTRLRGGDEQRLEKALLEQSVNYGMKSFEWNAPEESEKAREERVHIESRFQTFEKEAVAEAQAQYEKDILEAVEIDCSPASVKKATSAELERARLAKEYGEVTSEVIRYDNHGKAPVRLRKLNLLALAIEGHEDVLRAADEASVKNNIMDYAGNLHHYRNMKYILEKMGVDILNGEINLSEDNREKIREELKNVSTHTTLHAIGYSYEKRQAKNKDMTVKHISNILAVFGLKLACKRVTVNGVQTRVYSIDKASLELAHKMRMHQYNTLLEKV